MEDWICCCHLFAHVRHGATGVMDEWDEFVKNQRLLGFQNPKLICINL